MEIDTQAAEEKIKTLAQTLPPETAQHVLQLKMAMKNASEDEYNAVLDMLSHKQKEVPDSEEKSPDETEGTAILGNVDVDGHNGHGSRELLLEISDNGEEAGDFDGNSTGKDLSVDTKGQEDRKNDCDADEAPLDQACVTGDTSDDTFDSVDKKGITPNEDQKLHELSNEDEEVEDDLSTTNENSADFLQESASSSEDEKIPELLSKKADDVSSGVEFIDDEGPVERLSDRVEINEPSFVEETHSLQHAPLLNSLPQSLETEIINNNDPKIDEGESSSSDDDQVVSSSSLHSVATSSESDLSEAAVPNDSFQAIQSDGINDDIRNNEVAPGTISITGSKDDDIAIIEDERSHLEASEEQESVTVPVLERTLSTSSTGTQTSCENLHLAKDQSFKNTLGKLEFGNLDSILSGNGKGSSKLPFYYQPQIVMHGEKPVLVLQPVPSTTSSDNNDGVTGVENGSAKASLPIILPLASPIDIDKATKDAIFQQINGTATSQFEEEEECCIPNSSSESLSSGVSPSAMMLVSQQNDTDGDMQLNTTRHDKPLYESIPGADKCIETSESEETENLPEWVPASELDKAFSAAAEGTLESAKEQTPVTLTFPSVSLPSTNPFAKDLADQEYEYSDVKEDSLLNFGPEQMQQYSLFGPPSSPALSQGARPKTYQDPGHVGSATNPFAPDLNFKKQRRRQEQNPADATEVVISAEVHPSLGQPTVHSPSHSAQPKSHRHRMSSESMVTLIETSYSDTSLASFESLGVDKPQKTAQGEVLKPRPQQESKGTSQATKKAKLHVVSSS